MDVFKTLLGNFASIQWIALAGVLVGWMLAQGTELLKYLWQRRRLKNALYAEPYDVCKWLDRARLTQETSIQLLTHDALPDELTIPIATHVYDKYFAEISIDLSSGERVAFKSIFAKVNQVNASHQAIASLTRECLKDRSHLRLLKSMMEDVYRNTSTASILAMYL